LTALPIHGEIGIVITQGNKMNARWLRLLCAGALTLSSLSSQLAHAQYSWIDEKGSRVFSDRPPPPGTPPSRILKAPGGLAPASPPLPAAGADVGTGTEAGAANAAVPDWKVREEDYRKRSAVRAKAEEAERLASAKRSSEHAAECDWARGAMTQLDRVRGIEWTNKQGKREFMSDEDRAGERQRAQKILSSCR
jgi:hypothetical protein